MIITDIRQTSPGRLTVGFEDGSEVKSTLGVVTDLRLFSGKELDDEAIEAFRLDSVRALARERAMEMLSRRPMSRHELQRKLVEKGITPPVFASANTDQGDRANKAVIAEYRKRIRIL